MSGSAIIGVTGIGWVDAAAYGCVRQATTTVYAGPGQAPWRNTGLFSYPVKNLGRFDAPTRLACAVCALALQDAGLRYAEGVKQEIGLLGSNDDGCLAANRAFFQDYVESGRTLARGNLFIYTLPSSPLAETAIHFGFRGPVMYVGFEANGLGALLHTAAGLVREGQAEAVVVLKSDGLEGLGFTVAPLVAAGGGWTLESAAAPAEVAGTVRDAVTRLESGRCT